MSDKIQLKLLDELEAEMDAHDGKQYADAQQAKVKTVPMEAATEPDKLGNSMDKPKSEGNRTYMDPAREDMLKESEKQEASMRGMGRFGRSKRGNA